jgi:hypothetical protein
MDYGSGTALTKLQWEEMQFFKFRLSWFDDEEGAEMTYNNRQKLLQLLADLKLGYKKNSTVDIGKFPSVMSVGETFLAGVKYDFIQTINLPYNQTLGAVSPSSSNMSTSSFHREYPNQGNPVPCIDIGGKVKVIVPASKITDMLQYLKSLIPLKNMILFVNGYRDLTSVDGSEIASLSEYEDSNNKVAQSDLFNYWGGMDQLFCSRIGSKNLVYADGHHSVATSNHLSVSEFLRAQFSSAMDKFVCTSPTNPDICNYTSYSKTMEVPYLHTIKNIPGFYKRKANGVKAAQDFIEKVKTNVISCDKIHDTIDIVAHSMGYAYALGMIDKLKAEGYTMGRFYIIAAENACSGGTYWPWFNEVWQYGSNLGEEAPDPMYLQDGVAPQCACPNFVAAASANQGGKRIFIPKNWNPKGFVKSHSISNYQWIMNIGPNTGGYVKNR